LLARKADTSHRVEIMHIARGLLMKKAEAIAESVLAQPALENSDPRFIFARVLRRGQKLQPDRIQPETAQPQHPLERDRKIAAAFGIFRRESAAQKDSHGRRIACSRFRSSATSFI